MIGVLLISIGTTIRTIYSDFEIFMESHYFSPAALLVAIGVIIFFVATFGCVGAMRSSTCLINMVRLGLLHFLPTIKHTPLSVLVTVVLYPYFGNLCGDRSVHHEKGY